MRNVLAALAFLFVAATGFAQGKVGTVNSELLVASMPTMDSVQKSLQEYGAGLDKQYQELIGEYQKAAADYQRIDSLPTTTDAVRKSKGQTVGLIQQRIQQFEQNSQQMIGLKRNELMGPLYQKIGEAVDAVSEAQGYSQVFSTTGSGLAYADPKHDITQAVADKLKIKLLTEDDIRKMQEERQKLMQQQQQMGQQ